VAFVSFLATIRMSDGFLESFRNGIMWFRGGEWSDGLVLTDYAKIAMLRLGRCSNRIENSTAGRMNQEVHPCGNLMH
jgi:hypothetical protein